MTEQKVGRCWHCGVELASVDYSRENNCISCAKPTKVCWNCRWYSPGKANDCAEPMADRVMDKCQANYCEYFEPTFNTGSRGVPDADELKRAAEDLFK